MDELHDEIQRFLADSFEIVEEAPRVPARGVLATQDVRRLTLFKWRYSLESAGFTTSQAEQLLFSKWLHARRGVAG